MNPGLPFAANFDFSRAAAGLAFAATTAHGTRGFISGRGAEFVSRRFSSAVATCTIPVARGITIVATQGGHPAPPANFCDSDPGFRLCQTGLDRGSRSIWFSIKQTLPAQETAGRYKRNGHHHIVFFVAAAPSRVLRDGAGIFLFKLDHYLVQISLSPKKIRRPSHPILRGPRITGCSTNQN